MADPNTTVQWITQRIAELEDVASVSSARQAVMVMNVLEELADDVRKMPGALESGQPLAEARTALESYVKESPRQAAAALGAKKRALAILQSLVIQPQEILPETGEFSASLA